MNLESLGWSSYSDRSPQSFDLPIVRVVSQQRGEPTVSDGTRTFRAMLRGHLMDDPPIVGDWVRVRLLGDDAVIESVLPRRTRLERTRADGRGVQAIVANVDRVAAVCTADALNPARLERYHAAALGAGCEVRTVLTKADLAPEATLPDAIVCSTVDGRGVDALRAWIGAGTVAFIGTSGAGKSTLINALAGREVQLTGAVSEAHGKGRHTTTSRDLIQLPGGGCVIDTPGMRAFGLEGTADAAGVFPEIQALAEGCRYRDCTHHDEPGCAVQAAVDAGQLDAARLASMHKLEREQHSAAIRADKRLASEQRRAWARMTRNVHRIRNKRGEGW